MRFSSLLNRKWRKKYQKQLTLFQFSFPAEPEQSIPIAKSSLRSTFTSRVKCVVKYTTENLIFFDSSLSA